MKIGISQANNSSTGLAGSFNVIRKERDWNPTNAQE